MNWDQSENLYPTEPNVNKPEFTELTWFPPVQGFLLVREKWRSGEEEMTYS